MIRWAVYKGSRKWVAHRDWHVMSFPTWEEAYAYAYRHAMAAIHEIP